MNEANASNIENGDQYVCTWVYENNLFSITFYVDSNILYIMDTNGDFIEEDTALEFSTDCSNIQYWEI